MAKKTEAPLPSNPSPARINDPEISELCAYVRPSRAEYGTGPELDVLYEGRQGFYVPPLFGADAEL